MGIDRPAISVVIASVNGLPGIDECLAALENQKGGFDHEVIVADRCQNGTADYIRQKFPGVQLLHFDGRPSIPELRAIGMAKARGNIIVVTEDHCIAPDNWFAEIVKAHQSGHMVVGGAVENAKTDTILDWSTFLCEYSSAMLPVPAGEVDSIPGNNAAYKREVLDLVDDDIKRNYWEFFLHKELRNKGVKFVSVPTIVVKHKKGFAFFDFLSQRFHYSRSFAGMRRAGIPATQRLFYVCASPLLPLLVGMRIFRDIFFEKKRLYKEFVLSLPSLSIFAIAYALGEFVGYLVGPGHSLSRVE